MCDRLFAGASSRVIWVLLFCAFAVGNELLSAWSAALSDPGGGADIGLGLLLLVAWVLAGALGGAVDGSRAASDGRKPLAAKTVGRWVVVGLAAGLAAAVYRSVEDGDLDAVNVVANFVLSTIIGSFLVAVAGIAAAVVTQQLASNASRREQPSSPPPAKYAGPWDPPT